MGNAMKTLLVITIAIVSIGLASCGGDNSDAQDPENGETIHPPPEEPTEEDAPQPDAAPANSGAAIGAAAGGIIGRQYGAPIEGADDSGQSNTEPKRNLNEAELR